MYILGLNETIDELVMANSTHRHEHNVLKRENCHIVGCDAEPQRSKRMSKKTWEKHAEDKHVQIEHITGILSIKICLLTAAPQLIYTEALNASYSFTTTTHMNAHTGHQN